MSLVTPLNALSLTDGAEHLAHLNFLARRRYQLLGAVLLAVLIPEAISPNFDLFRLQVADPTTLGCLVAVLLGAYLLKRMTAFPGVSTVSMLLPALWISYASVV